MSTVVFDTDTREVIVKIIAVSKSTINIVDDDSVGEEFEESYSLLHKQREFMISLLDKHREDLEVAGQGVVEAISIGIWSVVLGITAAIIVAVGVVFFLSRSILSPIHALQQGAERIGKGDFNHRLDIKTGDEIEQLATYFNVMGRRIKKSHEHLEKKVEERTGELSRSNSALQSQIEQRKTIEEALWQQQEWSRAVIETSKDAMLAIDEDDKISLFNPAAEEMFGWSRLEAVGQPVDILIPETFRRKYRKRMRRLASRKSFIDRVGGALELNALKKDGTEFSVELALASETEGRVKFEFAVIRDITERKYNEYILRQAKNDAENANRVKSRFLANISHEIRTPINAIIGFSEIINNSKSLDDVEQQSGLILQESDHLLGLVNDLLDQAKIESGKMALESIPMNLHQLMQGLIGVNENRVSEKGLVLRLSIDKDVPEFIIGDALRLRQIASNLLTNAIKFTDKGSINVNVKSILVENSKNCRLYFEVVDTGIGIPSDKQDLIFESFSQADTSTTRKFGGTGLGTTISKQLVDLMKGDIGLQSEPGVGSTFWFALSFEVPLETSCVSEEVKENDDVSFEQHAGRILVAEDYPTNQQVVRLHLESAGHSVTIVEDGLQAVDACENQTFDMILMDVQMPNLDGNSAIRQIREGQSVCKDIPIVSLTAHADSESHKQCIDAGANEVVTKPVRRNILLSCVDKWLASEKSPAMSQQNDSELQAEELDVPFDFDTAVEEFGSVETILQIACQFLENVNEQVEKIRQAIAVSDLEAIRQHAHSVKGGAATLEAHPLSRVAKELESLSKTGVEQGISDIFEQFVSEYNRLKEYVDDKVRSQGEGVEK